MAKITEKYETILVTTLRNGEEGAKAISEKLQKLIEDNATPESVTVDVWGKRRLAYLINDEPDGFYTLFHFEAKPDFPAELERVANITDGVLRSLTTLAK
ncbi:MAG: 30S ribosomal protein S6 [Oscillospiraceae bacterium]|jgi:small subunit ribosomal protein S6|nr:30S ribosomal protein S6 [Oscillospiraceae bacterium]